MRAAGPGPTVLVIVALIVFFTDGVQQPPRVRTLSWGLLLAWTGVLAAGLTGLWRPGAVNTIWLAISAVAGLACLFKGGAVLMGRRVGIPSPFENLVLGAALVLTAAAAYRFILGHPSLHLYDGAVAVVPSFHVLNGLVPYRDFETPYAPGGFLLTGALFRISTIAGRNTFWLTLIAATVVGNLALARRTFGPSLWRLAAALLVLAHAMALWRYQYSGRDPLYGHLCLSFFLLVLAAAKNGAVSRGGRLGFFAFGLVGVWTNWDFSVTLFGVTLAAAATAALPLKGASPEDRTGWRALLSAAGWQAAGMTLGALALTLFLVSNGALSAAITHYFAVPLLLTGPYRTIPVGFGPPPFGEAPGLAAALMAIALFVAAWFGGGADRIRRATVCWCAFFPLAALPYAAGRSDWVHAIPLVQFSLTSLAGLMLAGVGRRALALTGVVLFGLTLGPEFRRISEADTESPDAWLSRELQGCREKIATVRPRSLYVAAVNYNHTMTNAVALYLLDPSLPPASNMTVDDPGVQATCEMGEKIAGDLRRAPRPMVIAVDLRPDGPDWKAAKQPPVSCGKIEAFLSTPHRRLGGCRAFERTFEMRLYE